MKLKEFGPPGGGAHPKFYYVDPPLEMSYISQGIWEMLTGFRSPPSGLPPPISKKPDSAPKNLQHNVTLRT